ncbi:MAG TPA: hypothetical protein VH164_17900, partial [Ktedonobacteraceae bacterium]|nr:hypothetical protein [Ktedonobacteraceae bacterium]
FHQSIESSRGMVAGDRGGREGRSYIHKFLTFLLVEISRSLLLIPGYRRAILIPSTNNLEVHK